MNRMIAILLGVFFFLGAGAFGFLYTQTEALAFIGGKGPDIPKTEEELLAAAEKQAEIEHEKCMANFEQRQKMKQKDKKFKDIRVVNPCLANDLPMEPLAVPIVDNRGASQVVTILITLEIGPHKDYRHAEKYVPKLRNAYTQNLYGFLNGYSATDAETIKLSQIKQRLREITDTILEDDTIVSEIKIQTVVQRRVS